MLNLYLNQWGGGGRKATPILALHGFTGSGLDFEYFAEILKDFSWWAPDLMGHGKSPITHQIADYTFSAHIDYLDVIAQQIKSSFILLGYSMGSRLALKYALERPKLIRELILIGVNPGIIDENERKIRQQSDESLANNLIEEGTEIFLKKWQSQPLIQSQMNIPHSIREKMFSRRSHNSAIGLANSLQGMSLGVMEPLWDRLQEIKCPISLITGEKDQKFCEIAKQMIIKVPSISHKVIPAAGHAAIWENMNDFSSFFRK